VPQRSFCRRIKRPWLKGNLLEGYYIHVSEFEGKFPVKVIPESADMCFEIGTHAFRFSILIELLPKEFNIKSEVPILIRMGGVWKREHEKIVYYYTGEVDDITTFRTYMRNAEERNRIRGLVEESGLEVICTSKIREVERTFTLYFGKLKFLRKALFSVSSNCYFNYFYDAVAYALSSHANSLWSEILRVIESMHDLFYISKPWLVVWKDISHLNSASRRDQCDRLLADFVILEKRDWRTLVKKRARTQSSRLLMFILNKIDRLHKNETVEA